MIEGTSSLHPQDPNTKWKEFEFKCKPGNTSRRPCLISPYHYRLDWLMWFAAFQQYQHNPWLLHLMGKMLENDSVVDSLIYVNPFRGKKPPKFVRARHYKVSNISIGIAHVFLILIVLQYTYTKQESRLARQGKWWNRKLIGEYVPEVNLEMLQRVYEQYGWTFRRDRE